MSSPASSSSNRLSPIGILLLLVSAVWCIVWFVHARGYWEDDSYIHLEFARSFANGQGFSFNGHVVYGDTSPMWVYLLDAFHALIPDWIKAGKTLNVVGVIFAATGVYFFARKLTGDVLFGTAMVLLFVVNPYFNYWAFSGMETITAAGLACFGATIVSDRNITWPAFFAGCLIAGLGPITRPEMVFLTAILALLLVYRWIHIPGPLAGKLPGFLAGLILVTGPTIAWSVYALHVFGRIVPNTNAAKRAGPHESIPIRLVTVYSLGFPAIVVAVAVGLIYLAIRLTRKNQRPLGESLRLLPVGGWVFIVWSAIACAFYTVNHTYVQTRYIFVSASGLLIVVMAIVYLAAPRLVRPVIVLTGLLAIALSVIATWPFVHNKSLEDAAVAEYSLWIKNNLPPDAPVAVYSIGEIAFISQHPIIDIGGITRPGVIPYLYDSASVVQRWAKQQGAQYSASGEQPEPGAVLIYDKTAPTVGWFLNPKRYRDVDPIRLWKLPPDAPR